MGTLKILYPQSMKAGDRVIVQWELEELPGTLAALTPGKATVVLDRYPDNEVSVPIETVRPAE